MSIRTTLSFTERHHGFLQQKVEEGVFASTSAAVEAMMQDENAREAALGAMAEAIRDRLATPPDEYLPADDVLAGARAAIRAARRGG